MLVLFVTRHLETDSKKMYTLNLSQGAHPAGAYPGFHSMKGQGVLLLPPGNKKMTITKFFLSTSVLE